MTKPKPVTLKIPVEVTGKYPMQRIELRLTDHQAKAARAIYDGIEGRELLADGRPVKRPAEAFLWLLEQVYGKIEKRVATQDKRDAKAKAAAQRRVRDEVEKANEARAERRRRERESQG